MTASSYADYVKELREVLADLVSQPDRYQTFSLHVELVMGSNLLVYETGKRKGQTDSIAYFRAPSGDSPVAPEAAYERVQAFLAMQDHIALSGNPMINLNEEYPHAVINIEHRARGAEFRKSMQMILVGVNDADDAAAYAAAAGVPSALVSIRPHRSARLWEWK
jgi:hypothetical protein